MDHILHAKFSRRLLIKVEFLWLCLFFFSIDEEPFLHLDLKIFFKENVKMIMFLSNLKCYCGEEPLFPCGVLNSWSLLIYVITSSELIRSNC